MARLWVAMLVLLLGAAAEPPALHLALRPDFIADDTVQKFEAETGITVTAETYPDDEALAAALDAGNPHGWDLVVASAVPVLARGMERHWFRPMEAAQLANIGNLDRQILDLLAPIDPGNMTAVPYLWGTAGLGLNLARLKTAVPDAPQDSLALVFDPAMAARTAACGLAMEDAPDDAIPAALLALGLDPESSAPHDLDKVEALLTRLKPFVRRLAANDFIEGLAGGSLCVGFGRSVAVSEAKSRAEERDVPVELTYAIPRERSRLWIDVLALPATARHVDEARAFVDFLLRPEVISDITDWTGAANPNLLAVAFLDEQDQKDETVFPSQPSRARLFLPPPLSPEAAARRARLWARTKP